MNEKYHTLFQGVHLQTCFTNGQLLVVSPVQKLAFDSFFWKTSYWTLACELITDAFKVRAPVKIAVVLLTLPWAKLPFALKFVTSLGSLLLVMSVELFLKVKITGKCFMNGMIFMNPKKRISFLFFWISFPFVAASYLVLFGANVTVNFYGFVKLFTASFCILYYLFIARLFVLVLMETWQIATFDLSFLLWYILPIVFSLFGLLEVTRLHAGDFLLATGFVHGMRVSLGKALHRAGDSIHPDGHVTRPMTRAKNTISEASAESSSSSDVFGQSVK